MSATIGITSRRFRHERLLDMALPAYEHAVRLLAAAAKARFAPIGAVIAIANGGLAPARGISGVLDIPSYRLTAKHNPTNATYTQATGHVVHDLRMLASALDGQQLADTVLLVDDICGSGATFTAVLSALRPHLHPKAVVRAVALCRNAGTAFDPDLWMWTVDDWVHFPWEPSAHCGLPIEELPILQRVEPT
jgi:hypoxanthine phosphoribosyltransferase